MRDPDWPKSLEDGVRPSEALSVCGSGTVRPWGRVAAWIPTTVRRRPSSASDRSSRCARTQVAEESAWGGPPLCACGSGHPGENARAWTPGATGHRPEGHGRLCAELQSQGFPDIPAWGRLASMLAGVPQFGRNLSSSLLTQLVLFSTSGSAPGSLTARHVEGRWSAMRRLAFLMGLTCLLLAACAPPPADTSETPLGLILFASSDSSNPDPLDHSLYSFTRGQARLVAAGLGVYFAASPDRKKVANYDVGYRVPPQVRIIALDTDSAEASTTVYGLPDPDDQIHEVIWSPDGTRLAVKRVPSLSVLSLATGDLVPVSTEHYNVYHIDSGPEHVVWSPDSSRIAFDVLNYADTPYLLSNLYGDRPAKLVIASADGTETRVLDEHGAYPVWSPDGRQILYQGGSRRDSSGHRCCNEAVYVIGADGTGKVQLASNVGIIDDWFHVCPYYDNLGWSSDGLRVFFIRAMEPLSYPRGVLSTVRTDGSDMIILDERASDVASLPQANRIAWEALLHAFVGNLDGTEKVDLAEGVISLSFLPSGIGCVGVDWRRPFTVTWSGYRREFTVDGGPCFFSPDCTQVAFEKNMQVYVVDASGHLQVTDVIPGTEIEFIAWIP